MLYCNLIRSRRYVTHIEPMIILQKTAIRFSTDQSYLAHTNKLFHQEKIIKYTDDNLYLAALFMFKNLNALKPSWSHNYNTNSKLLL